MDKTPHQPSNRKRRTLGTVTAATVGIAALTTAALLIPGTFAAAEPVDSSAKAKAEQPEYPIPELPPLQDGEAYEWSYQLFDGTDSEAAGEYGTAFYDWFAKTDIELSEKPPVQVFDNKIWLTNREAGEDKYTGKSLPVYSLSGVDYPDGWNGAVEFMKPGRNVSDALDLRIYPKASFKDGPGETFEYLADCTDGEVVTDMKMFVDYTCTETEGPNGERILAVEAVRTKAGTEDVYNKMNTVVVYRADGTAVVAGDRIPTYDHEEYPLDPKVNPYLGVDKLTELALSMPDAIVEG